MPYIKLYEEAGGITYRPITSDEASKEIKNYDQNKRLADVLDVFFISDEEFILWEGIALSHARLCTRLRLLQLKRQETKDILLERWLK